MLQKMYIYKYVIIHLNKYIKYKLCKLRKYVTKIVNIIDCFIVLTVLFF